MSDDAEVEWKSSYVDTTECSIRIYWLNKYLRLPQSEESVSSLRRLCCIEYITVI